MEQTQAQLGDFSDDCRALDAPEFADKWGEAFFIHHGDIGKFNRPRDRDKTLIRELLDAAYRARLQGREEDRDLIHRAIARIEGPEWDGLA